MKRVAISLTFVASIGMAVPATASAAELATPATTASGCGAEWCSGGFYLHPATCAKEGEWFLQNGGGWRRYTCRYNNATSAPRYHLWLSQSPSGNDAPWG